MSPNARSIIIVAYFYGKVQPLGCQILTIYISDNNLKWGICFFETPANTSKA